MPSFKSVRASILIAETVCTARPGRDPFVPALIAPLVVACLSVCSSAVASNQAGDSQIVT